MGKKAKNAADQPEGLIKSSFSENVEFSRAELDRRRELVKAFEQRIQELVKRNELPRRGRTGVVPIGLTQISMQPGKPAPHQRTTKAQAHKKADGPNG